MQTQVPSAVIPGTIPVPRYEEEEEDSDEDVYTPELPPDLAAARANPTVVPPTRRPIGPARGPLPLRREEEEEESEDEIGPAPPPAAASSSSSAHLHEDAVIDFMQKEAQRRQAIEVRRSSSRLGFLFSSPLCVCVSQVQCVHLHLHMCTRVRQCYLPMPLLYRRQRAPRR